MATSFHDKSDLGFYLKERLMLNDEKEFIERTWDYLLEKDLSFAVTDRDNNIVGFSLNTDGQDPPKISIANAFGITLELVDSAQKYVL